MRQSEVTETQTLSILKDHLGYAEGMNDARTLREDFFSVLPDFALS